MTDALQIAYAILFLGGLIFIAHLLAAAFDKIRIPDVLPLVLIGLVVGPILGFVSTASFGRVGGIFITVTLIILLFQSGLQLRFAQLKEAWMAGTMLTLVNFSVTTVFLAIFSFIFLRFSGIESLVFGAMLGGTSSAVVIPMIEKLKMGEKGKTALFLESTMSDVLCIVFVLAFIQAYQMADFQTIGVTRQVLLAFGIAALIGSVTAIVWSFVLSAIRNLENNMFTTPAFVFVIFGITEILGYSGAIAALSFGIVLGNIRSISFPVIKSAAHLHPIDLNNAEKLFFGEIVFILKTFFFVYIGISIQLGNLLYILIGILATVLLFVLRPVVVLLTLRSGMNKMDASLASVIVPKGLAAAVLAFLPLYAGMPHGELIQGTVYAVILFSIIVTAALAFLVEKGIFHKPFDSFFRKYPANDPPIA